MGFGVLVGLLLALWSQIGGYVRFETFLLHRQDLVGLVERNFAVALLGFIAIYAGIVMLSAPIASPLTLIGGSLFGWAYGAAAAVIGASLGAIGLFLLARGLLHEYFARRTEAWLGRLRAEFHADAASYLLILRVTPIFPFAVVNLAAALLGARLSTYAWTTVVGILPGTTAYALTGAGLGAVLDAEAARLLACRAAGATDCRASLHLSGLVSPELVWGLAGLATVMILSLIGRKWLRRGAAGTPQV